MGSRGTMIVEAEQKVFLFNEKDPTQEGAGDPKATTIGVTTAAGGKPALEAGGTWGPAASTTTAAGGPAGGTAGGPVSRGYTEEMEDFAYCIRQWDPKLGYSQKKDESYEQRLPRCHGEGGDGRRDHRDDREPGDEEPPANRVQARLVRA